MAKLILLQGLPGSGKSYYAHKMISENADLLRVAKDPLREMLRFIGKPKESYLTDEFTLEYIRKLKNEMITYLLHNGRNVINDDCNFNPEDIWELYHITQENKYSMEVHIIDKSLEECLEQDYERYYLHQEDKATYAVIKAKYFDKWRGSLIWLREFKNEKTCTIEEIKNARIYPENVKIILVT